MFGFEFGNDVVYLGSQNAPKYNRQKLNHHVWQSNNFFQQVGSWFTTEKSREFKSHFYKYELEWYWNKNKIVNN